MAMRMTRSRRERRASSCTAGAAGAWARSRAASNRAGRARAAVEAPVLTVVRLDAAARAVALVAAGSVRSALGVR